MIVLIVEDRPEVRLLWRRFTKPIATEIWEAEDMAGALVLMRRIPPPDLVLLDLNLPDSRDQQTLDAIEVFRTLNPRCLVIILTGNPDSSIRELAIRMGADAFADKAEIGTQTDLWRSVKRAIQAPNHRRAEPPFEKSLSLLERMSELALQAGKMLTL